MDLHARSRRRRIQQKLRKYLSKIVRLGGDRPRLRPAPASGGFALDALEERLLLSTTLYWDTNGATAGLGGSGTWDTTTANWTTDPTGASATQAWTAGADAVFDGTAGTVTV